MGDAPHTMPTDREYIQHLETELCRARADLQSFAHAVSHDLREPVRMILSFSQLLDKKYSARAGTDEKDRLYLEQIRTGSRRLGSMLDSLLTYARVDSQGQAMAAVPLARVLHAAWASLEQAGQVRDAVLQADDSLPEVWADESQLISVFAELLQNALKFRSTAPPHITVQARDIGHNQWRIEVGDNGIGIAADRCEVVFEMFKTLHHRDTYPGLGAGLAIVRRIIERHGGEIHAQPGETGGTTVWFSLRGGV